LGRISNAFSAILRRKQALRPCHRVKHRAGGTKGKFLSPCAPQAPSEILCPPARRRRQRNLFFPLRAAGASARFLAPCAPQAPTNGKFCPPAPRRSRRKIFDPVRDANGNGNLYPPVRRRRQRKIFVPRALRAAGANGIVFVILTPCAPQALAKNVCPPACRGR
jgi:hypothetical protein